MKTAERVARAIAAVHQPLINSPPDFIDTHWREYIPEAYAALGALGMADKILAEDAEPLSSDFHT